jgi:hypothetical protein
MKTLLLTLTAALGLTASVINSQAQISAGPAGMPSSLVIQPEYVFQQTGENFVTTNPPSKSQNSQAGAPDTTVSTKLGDTVITKHYEAISFQPAYSIVSAEENVARGMGFQESLTLIKGGYNHDGRAFMGWDAKVEAAAAKHEQEKNNGQREQLPVAPGFK